jgi:Tfp pilus assembly protein PilX
MISTLEIEAERLVRAVKEAAVSAAEERISNLEDFDDADATGAAARHVFWPCQHARQCGDCASRVWETPVKRRRCP